MCLRRKSIQRAGIAFVFTVAIAGSIAYFCQRFENSVTPRFPTSEVDTVKADLGGGDALLIIGTFFTFFGGRDVVRGEQATDWPSVEG